jgi:hypothetical protein|tara:strand:- start:45 stop:230 length:186 start_codon:yes stop_codon:yes gene_type:complete
MNIKSVEKGYSPMTNEHAFYTLTLDDDTVHCVPLDQGNRHYRAIQQWITDGGTVIDNGGGE